MNTYEKPVLALDIDGVCNAFAPIRPHVTRQAGGRWVKGEFHPYTLRFDNELADMIDALTEHFDIVWYTMWNDLANTEVAPLIGVGPFPVWHADHNKGWDTALARGTEQWNIHRLWYAKTPMIPEYAQGRPVCWLDDDHSGADVLWLAKQDDAPEHFMLLRTDADYGIQWDDVAALITWAQNLASGSLTSPTAYLGVKATVPSLPLDYEPVLWLDNDEPLPAVYDEDYEISDEELHAFLAKLEDEDA